MEREHVSTRAFLLKSAGIVAIFTIASRLTGFIRDTVLAYKFGATDFTDAYQVGLNIPFILFTAVNTALTTTFIPVFARVRREEGLDAAFRTSVAVINYSLLVGVILVALGEIFAVPLTRLVVPYFPEPKILLTAYLTRLMLPMILFQMLSGIFTGMLQSMNSFSLPALLGVISNGVIIASIAAARPGSGIMLAAWGNAVGFLVIVLVQLPALWKMGFRWGLVFERHNPGLVRMSQLVGPILIGSGVGQVGLLVDRMLASSLTGGSISALNYANRLFSLPGGTLGLAVYTVMYPTLAGLMARGDYDGFKRVLNEAIRFLNFMLFPIMVVLILLRFPIIELAFQHGVFDSRATVLTAFALLFFSLGIVTSSVRDLVGRAFWSQQNTITPMLIGIASVLVNIILDLALIHPLALGGLALGTSAAALVNSSLLLWMLKKKLGSIGAGLLLSSFWRVVVASGLTGLVAVWSYRLLLLVWPGERLSHQVLRLLLAVAAATVTYLTSTHVLRLPETRMLFHLVRRVRQAA
ncbi:MAG TPA: murein biosynthesis integral membrane protein MurJ [Spirochaetia bacterium]|nr:murein biosynthesis integral membrane protein MurJ [Spirochaetia bacterium]